MRHCVIDLATCPIDGAEAFLDAPTAPSNYRDPVKIAEFIAEKKAEQTSKLALDPDLGRIAMIGLWADDANASVVLECRDEDGERAALQSLASGYLDAKRTTYTRLVGYNALKFDWPFLLRRARYLGVRLEMNLDRYKTPHVDLAELLTHRGILSMRSLGFYVRRMGWSDLQKTLSGAEEALAPAKGQWAELGASVRHDVTATYRLAQWLGVIASDEAQAVGF